MSNTRKTPKLHEIWEIRHCESVIYSCSFPPKYTSDDANRMWVDLWIFMSRCSSAGFNFKIIDTWGQSLVVVGMGERLLRSLFGFALPSGPNLSSSSWLLKGLEERCWLYCTCTSITLACLGCVTWRTATTRLCQCAWDLQPILPPGFVVGSWRNCHNAILPDGVMVPDLPAWCCFQLGWKGRGPKQEQVSSSPSLAVRGFQFERACCCFLLVGWTSSDTLIYKEKKMSSGGVCVALDQATAAAQSISGVLRFCNLQGCEAGGRGGCVHVQGELVLLLWSDRDRWTWRGKHEHQKTKKCHYIQNM